MLGQLGGVDRGASSAPDMQDCPHHRGMGQEAAKVLHFGFYRLLLIIEKNKNALK